MSVSLSSFQDQGSGSIFGPSYKTSGLTEMAAQMTKLQEMAKNKEQVQFSEDELQELARETLAIYYNYPIDPKYIEELERVFSNTMTALSQIVNRSLDATTKTINRGEAALQPDNALLQKLRSEPRTRSQVATRTNGKPFTTQTVTSSSDSQPKDAINLRYLYEDVDMYRILTTQVAELPAAERINVLPPADNIIGEQLYNRLREEQQQSLGEPRTVLMPYNIGNYHWVGIAVQIAGDGNVRVSYMDPLQGGGGSIPVNIRAEILELYPGATISIANHLLQDDNSSCGPITIKNLMNVAQGTIPDSDQVMSDDQTRDLRQGHVTLMTRVFPDSDFERRQRENESTISTVFRMHEYLTKSAAVSFSTREYSRILKVVDNISELSQEPRHIIQAAFASIDENPLMDNAYYYRLLRLAIYQAFKQVQDSDNRADQEHMDMLLQSLWGVRLDDVINADSFNDPDLYKFRDFEEMKAIGIQMGRKSKAEVQELISEKTKEINELSAILDEAQKRKALIQALDRESEKQQSSLETLSSRKKS